MVETLGIVADRSMCVSAGDVVVTGYVDVFKVRLANRTRMAVGDIDRAYQKRLQAGPDRHPFPCPNGEWDGETFVIHDGRHEWLAAVALGYPVLLVAWLAPSEGFTAQSQGVKPSSAGGEKA